jgi:imidazolonepropionase-like amidohydrolase
LVPAPGDEVVRASDAVLLRGLVDSHVHLTFDHGPDHETTRTAAEKRSDEGLALLAIHNAQSCLRAGVTTVRDCGGRGRITRAVRDAVARGWIEGPRILAAGPPLTRERGHLDWCGMVADDEAALCAAIEELCAGGVDFIKIVASGGNMTPTSDPLEPQYRAEELAAATTMAHSLGRRVAAHALNAESVRRLVAAGVDTLEHCLWRSADGIDYDPSVAAQIARRDMWVGVTMTALDRRLLPGAVDASAAELRERHIEARMLLAEGARVMISSDAGVRNTRFDGFALSLRCAVDALDVSPVEAIHRATQVPAAALGLSDRIGSIEVGKQADLLLVTGDPARRIDDVANVIGVWRDGRRVATSERAGANALSSAGPKKGLLNAAST